jgi:hypothetical protein
MTSQRRSFPKGQAGKSKGRPEEREMIALARAHAPEAISVFADIMKDPRSPEAAVLAASKEIFDRGYGNPCEEDDVAASKFMVPYLKTDGLSDRQLTALNSALEKTVFRLASPPGLTSPEAIEECREQAWPPNTIPLPTLWMSRHCGAAPAKWADASPNIPNKSEHVRRVLWTRPPRLEVKKAEHMAPQGGASRGRPREMHETIELARAQGPGAIIALVGIMRNPERRPGSRVAAAKRILNWAYDKPMGTKEDDVDASKMRQKALRSLSDEELEVLELALGGDSVSSRV